MSAAPLAPSVTRRGRDVAAVPDCTNAHVAAGRTWTEADRAAVRRDAVTWAAAFRRRPNCATCRSWPFVGPHACIPHAGAPTS